MPTSVANPNDTSAQSITKYIPQLLTAIENEKTHIEDAFQAQICLGWLHWHLNEPALAAGRLPKNIANDLAQFDGPNKKPAEWTRVSALKASYVKGSSLSKGGSIAEGLETFESGLPVYASSSPKQRQWPEARIWAEIFLTGFCMLSSQAIKLRIISPAEPESLIAFRAWGAFCDTQNSTALGGRAPQADVSRRQVWKEYYTTLSYLLQHGLAFPPTHPTGPQSQPLTRSQQRSELKLVESKYEAILLKEVQFPTADSYSPEIEGFLEVVVQNWGVLCSGNWKDSDLGEGGVEGVSRSVLDILYQAATKTFHSTPILRHLFSVHIALAEFDLAFKAFDTYMDIVKTARARIEQTGNPEPGLDSDEVILKTGSECIKALCRYGSFQGAEKAKDVGQFFEDWLNKFHPVRSEDEKMKSVESGENVAKGRTVGPKIIALAWRCIGISHAQWARLTFDASSRADIQLKAIKCFRRSLLPEYESSTNVETLFALGTILAERRDISTAVEVVKLGLLPPTSKNRSNTEGSYVGEFARERSLIPLWHLMALLLSARQEFSMALRSCEGAFEQFKDPRNLFGEDSFTNRNNDLEEKYLSKQYGIVDEMDDFEKQNALEVKMTQLMLIEVIEGPEVAVNASGELLSLYTRLFGDPSKEVAHMLPSNPPPPPPSSSGTMRSLKGSIFGRSVRKSLPATASKETLPSHQRSNTIQTTASHIAGAPSIQVTSENGHDARHSHLTKGHRLEKARAAENVLQKKPSGTLRKRSASMGQRNLTVETGPKAHEVDSEEFFTPPGNTEEHSQWLDPGQRASQVGLAISPDNTSIDDEQDEMSDRPHRQTEKDIDLDLEQSLDHRLPSLSPYSSSTSPVTRFPPSQQRHRRAAILVRVWLLIAAFYRRAELYEDAKGSIEEAQKLVKGVDMDISNDQAKGLKTAHTGWGGGKSLGALWADVVAEVSSFASILLEHPLTLYPAWCSGCCPVVTIHCPWIVRKRFDTLCRSPCCNYWPV